MNFSVFREVRGLMQLHRAISHRFSTVRMADTIYVLEDGKILEGELTKS